MFCQKENLLLMMIVVEIVIMELITKTVVSSGQIKFCVEWMVNGINQVIFVDIINEEA